MKSADPRVKLLWAILCTSAALLFTCPIWLGGLCLFTLCSAVLFGAGCGRLARNLRGFFPFLLVLGLIQIVFTRSGEPCLTWAGVKLVSWDGLILAVNTALRFSVIFSAAALMAAENNRRMVAALNRMGMPYLFCFLLAAGLRFVPFFRCAFADALTTLQLRGVRLEQLPIDRKLQLYKELVLPVVADAVYRAQVLATAMEARGFGALPTRTSFLTVRMKGTDWLLTAVLIALAGTVLELYYS